MTATPYPLMAFLGLVVNNLNWGVGHFTFVLANGLKVGLQFANSLVHWFVLANGLVDGFVALHLFVHRNIANLWTRLAGFVFVV